ncbi:SHOCT domain-containing protein [Hephaestia sp. GCM10023244]|uniref:SHOCT domain-containing protein n=1 Tax=unclassified Hephaestia TaxID=2631281 RepID=UPI00207776E2|nr:SHOCT domain-containing protein [Hephaestia sp. MAHUQ-44]MCM8730888.1 SHOCT domain-containing protein [Hephaestia sp. MAHUQ-44]
MHLVVTIPGQPSVAVRKASIVRLAQWPMPGVVLPVLAERDDPHKYVILWDRVPSGSERGAQQAAQVASRLNGADQRAASTGAGAHAPRSGVVFGMPASISVNGQPATDEAIVAFEAMTGIDLNGDGMVGGRATASTGADPADDAAATGAEDRLRRLQSLRDDGLVSETEYQAKRAEILSGL